MYAGLVLLWLFDLAVWTDWESPPAARDSRLGAAAPYSGPVAAVLLLMPARWMRLEARAWLAALISPGPTAFAATTHLLPEEGPTGRTA
jgi:hypothetical protein